MLAARPLEEIRPVVERAIEEVGQPHQLPIDPHRVETSRHERAEEPRRELVVQRLQLADRVELDHQLAETLATSGACLPLIFVINVWWPSGHLDHLHVGF